MLRIELILSLTIIISVVAALIDFNTTEIPDQLSGLLILIGLLDTSGRYLSGYDITLTLTAFLVYLAIGITMYFTKQWGGGDSMLLVAYALTVAGGGSIAPWPFYASLLMNILFTGAIYGIFATLIIMMRKDVLKKVIKRLKKDILQFGLLIIAIAISSTLMLETGVFTSAGVMQFSLIFPIIFIFSKAAREVENSEFQKKIKAIDVRVEDWITEDVVLDGKVIAKKSSPGLTDRQVGIIKRNHKKIGYVNIKEGIPFGPVFPIALILTIYIGDLTHLLIWTFFT